MLLRMATVSLLPTSPRDRCWYLPSLLDQQFRRPSARARLGRPAWHHGRRHLLHGRVEQNQMTGHFAYVFDLLVLPFLT